MRTIIAVILAFISSALYSQQTGLTTSFAYNKLMINAAYAGVENNYTATALVRDQWSGIEGAPSTQLLSFDFPIVKQNIAFGMNVLHESIGIQNQLTASLSYAYIIKIKKSRLHLGLNISYRNLQQDFTDDRIIAIDGFTLDPIIQESLQSIHLFNTGIGAYFHGGGYYLGLSIPRLLKNSLSKSDLVTESEEVEHFHLMFGKEIDLSQHFKLFPEVLLRYTADVPLSMDFQLRAILAKSFLIGANYRYAQGVDSPAESIGVITGFNVNRNVLLGLAYDTNISLFKNSTNGSVEAFVRYRFGSEQSKGEIVNPRYF